MAAPDWMPLHVAKYLADTGHLSTVEHGAYFLLIMHYWQRGGLPDDDIKLARVARLPLKEWGSIRATIADLFGEGWSHGRIDEELTKAHALIDQRRNAGLSSAERRRQRSFNARSTSAGAKVADSSGQEPIQEQGREDLTVSSSNARDARAQERQTFAKQVEAEFEAFWTEYPHKVAKKAAKAAFFRARGNGHAVDVIAAGLASYAASKPPDFKWCHPATFLNGERFLDNPAPNHGQVSNGKPESGHSAMFTALADLAQAGPDEGRREALPSPGDGGDARPEGGHRSDSDDLEVPPFMRRQA